MKKIIGKLGVFGIILSAFIGLPLVKADTCTKHLQNYLFLDVDSISEYLTDTGYQTYGVYDYTFPKTGEVKVLSVGYDYVTNLESYNNFLSLYNLTTGTTYGYAQFNKSHSSFNTNLGLIYNLGSDKDYDDITILAHGKWARKNNYVQNNTEYWSNWNNFSSTDYILQNSLIRLGLTENDFTNVKIGGGIYNNTTFNYSGTYFSTPNTTNNGQELISYIQNLVDTKADSIGFSITRKLDTSRLNNIPAGYKINNNQYQKFNYGFLGAYDSNVDSSTTSATAPSSYFEVFSTSNNSSVGSGISYYWPFVLKVSYQVCPTASTESWNLFYDYNDPDGTAVNKPANQKALIDEAIIISSTEPTKEGYTFKGWCKDNTTCTDSEIYKAGAKIESNKDVTMYAQWGKTGKSKNEDTGVISYVVSFITTGLIASGIYLISKKKNMFKQI